VTHPTVHITEEVMREGMQIESVGISIEDKVRLLDALSETGLRRIVVGSFVRPEYTPQMAHIDEILERFSPKPGVTYLALALNDRGRQRAAAYAPPLTLDSMPPVLSMHLCDTFVRRNTNRSRQQESERWPAIVAAAAERERAAAAIGVGAAFGSNFEGAFTAQQRMEVLRAAHAAWREAGIPVTTVFLTDPMGWVTPWTVEEQIELIRSEWPEITHWYLHLHNSRGLALASTYEAIRVLDSGHDLYLDSTLGGIGGCPYCGNGRATGLVPTEDLVNMLEVLGIETGVALEPLIRSVWMLEEIIGAPTFGHVSKAGPHPHGDELYDPNLPFVETLEEARHFLLGPDVVAHQLRPWREPIPAPAR
jgi:hydroxymethylglutaryl-CoA lyase